MSLNGGFPESGLQDRPLDIRHLIFDEADDHPSAANGLHQVARQLALEQIQAGDRSRLIFLAAPGREPEIPSAIPAQILPLRGRRVLGRHIGLDRDVMDAILADSGPSTVYHIHGVRQPLLLPIARAMRQRRLPFGITAHSRFGHIYSLDGKLERPRAVLYIKLLERFALNAARFVHALTPHEADVVRWLVPGAKVALLPNAVYSSRLDGVPPPPDHRNPSVEFPTFGFFGRLAIEHKGLDLLVEGFARYRHSGGKGRLALFGSGQTHQQLAEMCAALGVADACTIEGPRFGQDKVEAASRWDFYVAPSRFDHMPLALMEAGLMGLPLILSEGTGLLGQVEAGRAGLAIAELSGQSVADAMHAAETIDPVQWRTLSRNAYRVALATGDWTTIAASLRDLYCGVHGTGDHSTRIPHRAMH
jgi:glycosyltransferase involved in cell wall biosynthesis